MTNKQKNCKHSFWLEGEDEENEEILMECCLCDLQFIEDRDFNKKILTKNI